MDINRRQFIQTGLKATLAFPLLASRVELPDTAKPLPDLVMVKGKSPAAITKLAINTLGGMKRFVSRGDIVVIKPNIGWDRVPEQAANTNPQVVKALVEMAYNAGAKQVKVFDNTCNEPRRCYVRSGIKEAAEAVGAKVSYMDERKFKSIKINGQVIKEWSIYTEILEADKVINVPIAKHHGLTRLTMAMKNWFGAIGGERNKLHQQVNEAIADFGLIFKPIVTVLDAYRILIANGPQGGNLHDVRELGTVIAGTDQVAIDSLGAELFGLKGRDLGYLVQAQILNLGELDISKLRLATLEI
jgi:uncharacterized protein (DUF362 family)